MIATPPIEGTTMAAQSGKTSSKSSTVPVKTSTTSSAPTGRPVEQSTATTQRTDTPSVPARPAPSARSGIRIHVNTVLAALDIGGSSRSVKAIQYALADRGFDPGTRAGRFDNATRDAYRKYQISINESATGVPTGASLNFLGFDII